LYCNTQPHQLSGVYASGSTCSSKNGAVYTSGYDNWGNVTSRTYSGTTATLSYDLFDHLTQWYVSATNQEQYLYDASGERVLRRSTNTSGTTLTVYAFGLEDHQYSGGGTNQANTYYYTLAGRLLGALDSNGTTFYLTDTLGSVLLSFTNVAGGASIKAGQVFGPYGNARYHAGTFNTAKGFTGQYNDGLTGLDYYGARYYDPVVGVFLSADSVDGNALGDNPYAYVGGNPETFSDPSGHLLTWHGGAGGDGWTSPVTYGTNPNAWTNYGPPVAPSVVGGFGGPSISGYQPGATSGPSVSQDTCSQLGCSVWARLRTGSIQVATPAQTTMCMFGACFQVPALSYHWVDTETPACLATGPYVCHNEASDSSAEGDRDKNLGGVADGGIMAADAAGGEAGTNEGYPNKSPGTLQGDLEEAGRLGVHPLKIGDPELHGMLQGASKENPFRIKWAVNTNGDLGIIPHSVPDPLSGNGFTEIYHTVIFGGENVLVAGEGGLFINDDGIYEAAWLDNNSGHYVPRDLAAWDRAYNTIGIPAFRDAGVIVPEDLEF